MTTKKKIICTPDTFPRTKLKILGIHGYRQNAEVFKSKTDSFRGFTHMWARFSYVTAPHKVLVDDDDNDDYMDTVQDKNEQYGWFFNKDDNTFRGTRKGGPAIGFEESLKHIEKVFEADGPFDGLFGFSQGACFVGLLCDLQHRGMLPFKFDFAIMSSGFKSSSLPHMKYYAETISIPTLHIYGENDKIIPPEMSIELANCFDDPMVQRHPFGHYLPSTAVQRQSYLNFMRDQFLTENSADLAVPSSPNLLAALKLFPSVTYL